ncbi:formylglycine-generating enzyme family protein [candidate division KSB1 bacterium]
MRKLLLIFLFCPYLYFGLSQTSQTEIPENLPELVLIPEGEFFMGAENGDNDEKIVHKVYIRSSFYIGKYEVSQQEWQEIMESNPSHFKGDNRPVENITWEEAQEYLKRLSDLTGYTYRLPTETEWEYACRSESKSEFPFENDGETLENFAWYENNSNTETSPVGLKNPNKWGLYDVLGNVSEMCMDWYFPKYTSDTPLYDPKGPSTGTYRVIRGGSWFDNEYHLRVSNRNIIDPEARCFNVGFRVVRDK